MWDRAVYGHTLGPRPFALCDEFCIEQSAILVGKCLSSSASVYHSSIPVFTSLNWTEQGLTSHQTHYRSYWGRVLWVKRPNHQCHRLIALKEESPKDQASIPLCPPHCADNNTTYMQYETYSRVLAVTDLMKLLTRDKGILHVKNVIFLKIFDLLSDWLTSLVVYDGVHNSTFSVHCYFTCFCFSAYSWSTYMRSISPSVFVVMGPSLWCGLYQM